MILLILMTIISDNLHSNLVQRAKLLSKCEHDLELQAHVRELCSRDFLFYTDNFVFTFDPRKTFYDITDIPFLLFQKQRDFCLDLINSIDNEIDTALEKSRDEGATWMVLTVLHWYWLFKNGGNSLIGSMNESAIHRNSDMSSLFPKLFYINSKLPKWLLPKGFSSNEHENFMRLVNPESNTTITGQTGRFFGTSGRYRAILFDELSKWQDGLDSVGWESAQQSTKCRIAIATAYGQYGTYYRLVSNTEKSSIKKMRIHWTDDPRKTEDIQWLDCEYEDFKKSPAKNEELYLKFDGLRSREKKNGYQPTSKWYRNECLRFVSDLEKGDQGIKQELDIVYLGTGRTYFDQNIVEELLLQCKEPLFKGELQRKKQGFDTELEEFYFGKSSTVEFVEKSDGDFWIWEKPFDACYENQYAFSVDVAKGLNNKNDYSCIEVMNRETRLTAARFLARVENIDEICVMVYEYYGKKGAFLPDATGNSSVAIELSKQGVDLVRYINESKTKHNVVQDKGFIFTRASKPLLFRSFQRHLAARDFIDYDERLYLQMKTFINDNGVLKGAGKGELQSHDDIVDNKALILYADDNMGGFEEEKKEFYTENKKREYVKHIDTAQVYDTARLI